MPGLGSHRQAQVAMPPITEFQLQRAVRIFLDAHAFSDVVYWHTPNQGAGRSAQQGKTLKDMGVLAGIPDWLLLRHGKLYGLELKLPGKKTSKDQNETHARLLNSGCTAIATLDDLSDVRKQLFLWFLVDSP